MACGDALCHIVGKPLEAWGDDPYLNYFKPEDLQGQLDDPHFPEPLSVAVFPQPDDTLNVAWSRPKARAAAPRAGAAASTT